jgi:hypothetical protein
MRETLISHFDVVVVVWALALALSWTVLVLSRAELTNDQWSHAPQAGPVWIVPDGDPGAR